MRRRRIQPAGNDPLTPLQQVRLEKAAELRRMRSDARIDRELSRARRAAAHNANDGTWPPPKKG